MWPLPARILVPTDFSDGASVAEEYASTLAAALGARLHVLHVMSDQPLAEDLGRDAVPELLERTEREVRRRLESWSSSGGGRQLDVVADVGWGLPDATIVQYADAHGIDLIVIGRCGHSRPKPPQLGHVAVGVLQKARCPVLAVDGGSAAPDPPNSLRSHLDNRREGHGAG